MRHVVEHAPQLGPGRGKVGGRADGADLVGRPRLPTKRSVRTALPPR